ncbi:hypothetical protein LCGC14_2967770, partial [marine sediment metagenome]
MPVTEYVPADAGKPSARKRPALIMIPAHHTGRNSKDLVVLGANFARAGGVALAMESIGSGERGSGALWAHKNHQRSMTGLQVLLTGDNLAIKGIAEMRGLTPLPPVRRGRLRKIEAEAQGIIPKRLFNGPVSTRPWVRKLSGEDREALWRLGKEHSKSRTLGT